MNSSLPTAYRSENLPIATLKRTRSEEIKPRNFDASRLPPLPRISGDVALQVFTHISLRRPDASPTDYGDNERLAYLGRPLLELAVTHVLFQCRPILRGIEISGIRAQLLSSTVVSDWVAAYKLSPKLRCHPALQSSLNLPQEMLNLFHAYVGGLFLSPNQHVINEWIRGLLEPEIEFLRSRTDPSLHIHLLEQNLPSPKRTKSEGITPDLRSSYPMQSKPQPAPRVIKQIPPLQAMAVLPNPLAPAQPGLPFLPLFNQAAMQRRVTVEYIAEFSGPSHAGRWTVKCVVNGICKGEGAGPSKQIAKEEAARKAYYSMGWT